MDADGGEQVGVGGRHDRGLGAAGGEAGNIDTGRVDAVLGHDLAA